MKQGKFAHSVIQSKFAHSVILNAAQRSEESKILAKKQAHVLLRI